MARCFVNDNNKTIYNLEKNRYIRMENSLEKAIADYRIIGKFDDDADILYSSPNEAHVQVITERILATLAAYRDSSVRSDFIIELYEREQAKNG